MKHLHNPSIDPSILEAGAMLHLTAKQRAELTAMATELGPEASLRRVLGAFVSRVGNAEYQLEHPDEAQQYEVWHFQLDRGQTHVFANVNRYPIRDGGIVEARNFAIVEQNGDLISETEHPDTYKALGAYATHLMVGPIDGAPDWATDLAAQDLPSHDL